jgi:hypothetical protein
MVQEMEINEEIYQQFAQVERIQLFAFIEQESLLFLVGFQRLHEKDQFIA